MAPGMTEQTEPIARPAPGAEAADGAAAATLLAYDRLLDAALEAGGSEELLRRALQILAELPWLRPHRRRKLSAFLADAGTKTLRLVAHFDENGAPPDFCREVDIGACICGAVLAAGQPVRVTAGDRAGDAPCAAAAGTHVVHPLAAKGVTLGVLHLLLDEPDDLTPAEEAFLARIAGVLGAELLRRRHEEEHERLEAQFLQAQKMEAVGRLAGGVAHDFNNILTAITSYSELGLVKLGPQDPLRRNFDEILAAADRAADLTRQLLAFSRRQILVPKVIDLNAIIKEMAKMLRRLLGEDVELVLKTRHAGLLISADPAQIEQVLINLAVNSRDAMPRGGRLVIETDQVRLDESYSRAHPDITAGDYACIAMSDTGTGMTDEVKRRIFEPFFSTKDQKYGTGLGLAAVYGVVHQSGGHIWVYSEPGLGTTFKIYFPTASGATAGEGEHQAMSEVPRGTETILVAEDDDAVRVVVVEVLREFGYAILEAREGREAIALAAGHPAIDLLLSDVVMPGMSGKELHEHLRAVRPGLPVLYISGYTDEAIVHHGILEPGTEFLQKPFNPSTLALRVRQALDKRGC
jgi:signal transduction histidine kinase/ActR/RegA family two-component response regulator